MSIAEELAAVWDVSPERAEELVLKHPHATAETIAEEYGLELIADAN